MKVNQSTHSAVEWIHSQPHLQYPREAQEIKMDLQEHSP
jgi:hypothetical protein